MFMEHLAMEGHRRGIPATITFTPGGLYQLWLVALNSRGHSDPGPVQNWTAV